MQANKKLKAYIPKAYLLNSLSLHDLEPILVPNNKGRK